MRNSQTIRAIYIVVMLIAIVLMWFKIDENGTFIYTVIAVGSIAQIVVQLATIKNWTFTQVSYLLCDLFALLIIGIHFIFDLQVINFLIVSILLRFMISYKEAKKNTA